MGGVGGTFLEPGGGTIIGGITVGEAGATLDAGLGGYIVIEDKSARLRELMPECYIDILCGVFSESGQGGFLLNSVILKKLTAFLIDIVFELHISSSLKEDQSPW